MHIRFTEAYLFECGDVGCDIFLSVRMLFSISRSSVCSEGYMSFLDLLHELQ